MRIVGKFIFFIITNAVALYAAGYLVTGFVIQGTIINLFIAALILTVINFTIRPILKLVLGPLVVLTLGLFVIIINAGMLYILDMLSDEITIQGIGALIWGTIIMGLVNGILHLPKSK